MAHVFQATLETVPAQPHAQGAWISLESAQLQQYIPTPSLHIDSFNDTIFNLKSKYKTFLYLALKLKRSSVLVFLSNVSLFCNNKNAIFHPRTGCMPK